ncbi:MAG: glutathione peroxidase [Pseudomonadota bacterium]
MTDWTRRMTLGGIAGLATLGVTGVQAATKDAHDFAFTSIDGELLPLSTFDGKVLMVVNTASLCGFTRQYAGLQSLWERYRDEGFVLLGVPSNDFGGQEPGSEAEIKHFCEVNFDIDFPLTEKQQVKGGSAHPFYAWARSVLGADKAPRWNFHKYLVARDGTLTNAFATSVRPDDPKLISTIEALLQDSLS